MFKWKAAYTPHKGCGDTEIKCIKDIEKAGFKTIPAEVPGNFEIDLINAGLLEPIYYSVNTLETQKLENTDIWYYTVFETDDANIYLHFDGIDSISDIYINGKLVKSTDNMFIGYDVDGEFNVGLLNSEGITTKRGCEWTQNAVSRILTNQLYIGKVINCKEEIKDFLTGVRTSVDKEDWLITERPDLAIIDTETFENAQRILQKHKDTFHVTGRRNCSKHIFSTLLRCTDCGYSFRRFERKYKNTYVSWACSGRNAKGAESCHNTTTLDEGELLESIRSYLEKLVIDKKSTIKKVVADFNKNYKSNNENAKTEKELQNEIKALKKKRQKYMDMYENDIITMLELKAQTADINCDIGKCEDKLKIVHYNLSQGSRLTHNLNATFTSIEEILQTKDITNEMLKKVIDRIDVSEGGKVDIYFKLFKDIGLDETFLFDSSST